MQGYADGSSLVVFPYNHNVGSWHSFKIEAGNLSGLESEGSLCIQYNVNSDSNKPKCVLQNSSYAQIGECEKDLSNNSSVTFSFNDTDITAMKSENQIKEIYVTGEGYTITKISLKTSSSAAEKELFPIIPIPQWGGFSLDKNLFSSVALNDVIRVEVEQEGNDSKSVGLRNPDGWAEITGITDTTPSSEGVSEWIVTSDLLSVLKDKGLVISARSSGISLKKVTMIHRDLSLLEESTGMGDNDSYTSSTRIMHTGSAWSGIQRNYGDNSSTQGAAIALEYGSTANLSVNVEYIDGSNDNSV